MNKGTKANSVIKKKKKQVTGDARFTQMHTDPKFLPVDGRASVVDKRFSGMLDPEFVMLRMYLIYIALILVENNKSAKGQKAEQYMKNQLRNVYKFSKNKESQAVQELKREAAKLEEFDDDDDSADEEERVSLTQDDLMQDDEEEQVKEKEYTFDEFLSSLRNRPGFEDIDDVKDDVYDFDAEAQVEAEYALLLCLYLQSGAIATR